MSKKVAIMSVGSFDEELIEEVARRLSTILDLSFKVERGIKLPENAYNALRRQYISDIILQELSKVFFRRNYFRILGLTEANIYTDNLNFIFGQAIMNGCCAVVSIYMLDERNYGREEDNELLLLRTVKECVHELGHTLGLTHCKNPKCVMRFSNSISWVDYKNEDFCYVCKNKISRYLKG